MVWPGLSEVVGGFISECERVYALVKLAISKAIKPIVAIEF